MSHNNQESCCQNSCSTGSCSSGQSSKCGCGCGCKCGCGSSCGCQKSHGSCQGKYSEQLLHLADEAWMEVLKEKIKEEIRTNSSEQLTQLAKLVSTANHARWKEKMQSKKECEDFECQLRNVMCSNKK